MGAGFPMTAPEMHVDAFVGVATTFINAATAFNNQDLTTLRNLIDDNAVLYKIKSGSPIIGKDLILAYLDAKFTADEPICALITTEIHPPSLPTSARGTALWGSANNPAISFSVRYEINFQPHYPYLITSFWARPSS